MRESGAGVDTGCVWLCAGTGCAPLRILEVRYSRFLITSTQTNTASSNRQAVRESRHQKEGSAQHTGMKEAMAVMIVGTAIGGSGEK